MRKIVSTFAIAFGVLTNSPSVEPAGAAARR
jgi:hypothetical protein